jgi:hypothetical protein
MKERKGFFFEKKNQKTFELNGALAKSRHARVVRSTHSRDGGHQRLA